jgi:hypothetical protein
LTSESAREHGASGAAFVGLHELAAGKVGVVGTGHFPGVKLGDAGRGLGESAPGQPEEVPGNGGTGLAVLRADQEPKSL